MKTVSIITPLRDASHLLPDFMRRYRDFDRAGLKLDLIFVEGDSLDDTWAKLLVLATCNDDIRAIKFETHLPRFGSVVDAARFAALASIFNAGLGALDLEHIDYALMLPIDIIASADLVARLVGYDLPLVSPLVFNQSTGLFYDTWAFENKHNGWLGPFHKDDTARVFPESYPVPMNTIGGTMLMQVDVLRAGVRYTSLEVDRGLCREAAARGFTCWADPTTRVFHP